MKPAAILGALLFLWGGSSAATAGFNGTGTTSAQFLTADVDARATALGQAASAVVDGATGLHWNPAALTRIERRSAVLMYANELDVGHSDVLAYGHRLDSRGVLGAGIQYHTLGALAGTDESGQDTAPFTPYDAAFTLGYAYRLSRFSLGGAAKYIQSRVLTSARAYALDFGILSPSYAQGRFRWAMALSNLGTKLKFERAAERLPLSFRAGGAYRFGDRCLIAAESIFPRDEEPYFALGGEWTVLQRNALSMSARVGWNSQAWTDLGILSGVSSGFGLRVARIEIDYGFRWQGDLGPIHRIGLSHEI
jgi:hypothetical protein